MGHAFKLGQLTLPQLMQQVCREMNLLTGNVYGEKQLPMVEARLRRRMRELKLESPQAYQEHWLANRETENKALIALLTTHFTSFFREFMHFEHLLEILPELVEKVRAQGRNEIRLWSAACSKGHEVWSLAMWLHHHLPLIDPKMSYSVLGTDIDAASLSEASNGVYHARELQTAPIHLWQPVWVRGQGDISEWYKAKKVLRDRVRFSTANMLNLQGFSEAHFDVVLCRNVLIYFSPADQAQAAKNLLAHLHPHGRLISGVSESLASFGLGLRTEAPSVYLREASAPGAKKAGKASAVTVPKPLRVLCVDDSGPVLSILKKVLQGPEFEVVGTASDGEAALRQFEALKPDVVTLDLHMPTLDGFGLVNDRQFARRAPVVVVSSVARENSDLVLPLFSNGVRDFVEKPTFENLQQVGEELRQKLKMAWLSTQRNLAVRDTEALKKPAKRERTPGLVILAGGLSDREAIRETVARHQLFPDQLRIVLDAPEHLWQQWSTQLRDEFPRSNLTFVASSETAFEVSLPSVLLMFRGGPQRLFSWGLPKELYVILEEGEWPEAVLKVSHDSFPATSLSYMAAKHLGGT